MERNVGRPQPLEPEVFSPAELGKILCTVSAFWDDKRCCEPQPPNRDEETRQGRCKRSWYAKHGFFFHPMEEWKVQNWLPSADEGAAVQTKTTFVSCRHPQSQQFGLMQLPHSKPAAQMPGRWRPSRRCSFFERL